MNALVCRLAALSLTAAALSACGKKSASLDVEGTVPAEPGKASERAVAAATQNPAAPPAVPNLSADLLAADGAYEAWFKKYKLELNDPKMLDADPDADGSSNRDEFMADTNPLDANSRPGIHKVMRLKEYNEFQVPLMLESVDGHVAKIKRLDKGEQQSSTVAVGQMLDGMKVEKILSRHVTDKVGTPLDLSQVDLGDPVTKAKVVLVKNMPTKSADSYAVLVSADGTSLKVHKGEVFAWPTEHGGTYKVIDLRPDQAVVQAVETQQMWTIPKK